MTFSSVAVVDDKKRSGIFFISGGKWVLLPSSESKKKLQHAITVAKKRETEEKTSLDSKSSKKGLKMGKLLLAFVAKAPRWDVIHPVPPFSWSFPKE